MYLKAEGTKTAKKQKDKKHEICSFKKMQGVICAGISLGNKLVLWSLGTVRKITISYLISSVTSVLSTFFVYKKYIRKLHQRYVSYSPTKMKK